jgi:hypothetical protein
MSHVLFRVSRVWIVRIAACCLHAMSRVSVRRRILLFACCLHIVDIPSRVRAAHLGRVLRAAHACRALSARDIKVVRL